MSAWTLDISPTSKTCATASGTSSSASRVTDRAHRPGPPRGTALDARARPRALGGCHVRAAAARSRWASPLAIDDARLPRRSPAAEQGAPLSGRSAESREIVAVITMRPRKRRPCRLSPAARILWRAALRVQEALALAESDLDPRRGALLVRRGKGGRRREVGMDNWAWQELQPWLDVRLELPVGPLFCILNGSTRGRHGSTAAARAQAATHRSGRRRPATLCPAPAPPRSRGRDGTRGRAADRDPAPTRAQ